MFSGGFRRAFSGGARFSRKFSSGAATENIPLSGAKTERKWLRRSALAIAGLAVAGGLLLPSNSVDATVRFCRSAWAGALVSAEYKKSEKASIGASIEEATRLKREAHEKAAKILLDLFKKQGGVYVKAGQHISSLYYLLPIEFCETMKELHNRASTRPFEEVVQVFVEDLGGRPEQIFDEFDPKPIAAASLAQVHKAVYQGKPVAVKVQFPDLDVKSSADVATIDTITKAVEWLFPDFKLGWLVREFEENLPKELNFQLEAANANRIRECFKDDPYCTAPEIYKATRRLLIMEFIDGVPVNDPASLKKIGVNPSTIVHNLNRVFNEQIFLHRFTHCDPHPGNVLVRKKNGRPEIVLLDNGLYREYDMEFGIKYAELWMAILQQDEARIAKWSKQLGVGDYELFASMLTARSWQSVRNNIYRSLESEELSYIQEQAARRASDITSILATVPSPLLLLLKTNDLLRVVNQDLGSSSHKVFGTTMQACQQLLHQRLVSEHPGWSSYCKIVWERFSLRLKLTLFDLYVALLRPFGAQVGRVD